MSESEEEDDEPVLLLLLEDALRDWSSAMAAAGVEVPMAATGKKMERHEIIASRRDGEGGRRR